GPDRLPDRVRGHRGGVPGGAGRGRGGAAGADLTRGGRRMSGPSTGAGAGALATLRDTTPAARALLAGVVVNKLGAFIQVFLVLFRTARGFSGVQAGLALGGYGAGSVLGVLAGGALTDRLGPRRTILASMAGSAALILAILYLPGYPGLLLA